MARSQARVIANREVRIRRWYEVTDANGWASHFSTLREARQEQALAVREHVDQLMVEASNAD